jgi:hypothetical protein
MILDNDRSVAVKYLLKCAVQNHHGQPGKTGTIK